MAVSSVQAITISKKKPFRWSYGSGYGAFFIIECFFATKCVTMAFIQFCLLLPCPYPNLVNFHKERIIILDENERYGNSISSSQ